MTKELRFGVLGAGQISRYACQEINRHPGAKVVAVSDPSAERLADFARTQGVTKTYQDNEALLADASLDCIFVATPNAFHAPLAKRALELGKHVIVEKPFATNAAEAAEVVAAAERAGKLLTVGMNQRFRPDSQRIAELVQQGALGDVYHTKAFWFRRTGIPKLGTWFGKKSLAGGGALYDIGVHLLDLALFLLGDFNPESVSGRVYTTFGNRGLGEGGWGLSDPTHPEFDVDDHATALLRFSDGKTLTLDVSWAIHQKDHDRMNVVLHGSEAGAGCYPGELYRYGREKGVYEISTLGGALRYPHANRFDNFIETLLGREELCVTPAQALAVQRTLDAIYESSRLGREVRLSPAPPAKTQPIE